MSLSHEHVGSKIPAKINTFMVTRAELLIHLCHEIPCTVDEKKQFISFYHFMDIFGGICSGNLVEHEQQWCVLSTRFGVAFCLPILF